MKEDRRPASRLYVILLALPLVLLLFSPLASLPGSMRTAHGAASGTETLQYPLDGMPGSPEEAHALLEDREEAWPDDLGANTGDFEAASVQSGLRVSLPFDIVTGNTTHANAQVKVELIRGGGTIKTVNTTTDSQKFFSADFSTVSGDIQSGDKIKVTDMAGGAAVEVDCTLTAVVSAANNRVSGAAKTGNKVDVYIQAPSTYYGDIPPGVASKQVTASGGAYSATISGFDIRRGDVAFVYSTDGGGNSVMEAANTGGTLVVYPQYDEVMGYYLPSTNLTVYAGSESRNTTTAGDGFLDAWFVGYDIVPGDQVRCNMGGNRSITVQDISSIADPYTNMVSGTAPPNTYLRITMDAFVDPVVFEVNTDGSGAFSINLNDRYSISGNEVYNVAWYNGAGDCVVYGFQTFSWYLPEGYTGKGFDEWVLVMNPTNSNAQFRVVFQTLTGPREGPLIDALPNSRSTIHVNEWAPEEQVSTMVTSVRGAKIMAERAMYMYGTPDGKWGAHDSKGILTPSSVWYLAEGATYYGFDEWVLIQNPNDIEVMVRVQFLGRGGLEKELEIGIGARSRFSIHVNPEVPDKEVSTKVECLTQVAGETLPVFCERAMYMATLDGKRGSHDSIGLCCPRQEWYLPEGTTRPGFDEWVLVMNPNDFGTKVNAKFLTPEGIGNEFRFDMGANSRFSIHVNDFIVDNDVSTVVESLDGAGILAERAMYIHTTDGKQGAHDSIGSSETQTYWYLPEGTTRPGFDEWVLVQNPNEQTAEIQVTLLGPDGPAAQIVFTMQPESRFTVHVNDMVNNLDVSTVVESIGSSPVGVLAERAMYMWTTDNKQGAHDSIGIPSF
ncbi:MAG: hypothetical protein SWK76_06575 [Actinomycetota bacterium]|nr:hypothetical protein [Actinomycetota bacterium]